MNPTTENTNALNNLHKLAAFARYLLNNHLNEYVEKQQAFSYQLNIPLLRFFSSLPAEQREAVVRKSSSDFLTQLGATNAAGQIEQSMRQWMANQMPVVEKDAITAEDITLVNHLRKKTLLHFIPGYTQQADEILTLVEEIDFFTLQAITVATNLYIDLMRQRLQENAHFIEKVAETIPGAVYVFDVQAYKGVYSNNKLADVIGYEQQDLNALGDKAIPSLIHPDDQAVLKERLGDVASAQDDQIIISKYRIRKKDGGYKWLSNYESVFKRTEAGEVWQTIGITLDVDNEQRASEALHRREQQLTETLLQLAEADQRHKQAEALAHIGTYAMNPMSGAVEWSDEMYRIYETDKTAQLSYGFVLNAICDDDRTMADKKFRESLSLLRPYDFYYRVRTPGGGIKILHTRGQVEQANGGQMLVGTDQDVTEKQTLIRDLVKSESLYKQAEEIADMGNWNWDASTNKLTWTDQLYRIYGLQPQAEEMTIARFLTFVHPSDLAYVKAGVDKLATEDSLDYTFRIVTEGGAEKWLRSIAQVLRNEEGNTAFVVGTEQDVTEKQTLIQRLQESEKLYKQAQSMARIGNWTWDLQTKVIAWSDELFRIYELNRDEPLSQEEWESLLDPAEKEKVIAASDECIRNGKQLDITHKVTLPGGTVKILHRKGEVLYDVVGRPIKIIGTTQDVTEQFSIQAELRESQTFIRKITDATPSIIASYNVNTGQYVYISEGLQKLLGYDTTEVMQKGVSFFAGIMHPDDLGPVMEKNTKALEEASAPGAREDGVTEFTYRMKHADGDYRWFHTYGTVFDRNKEGRVEHILNISLDVTEQKQALQIIKEQEHFIQQIADASPTILYLFDVPSQSIAYINREAFFVLGYLPDDIIEEGSAITSLLYHPDDLHLLPQRRQSKKIFQQVDSMIQYECRLRHKDGDYRWLLIREIVFKTSEDGSITQIIGAALDINKRKEMEKTILQNSLQLQQSNTSLEEFAYVASHDLKEPLRKISTFGDRLVASQMDKMSDEGKLFLGKIVDASQRMQNMISDLLSISLISGNSGFESTSLLTILEDALQALEIKIEQQDAIIRYGALPTANIIPSQFRQLFQNLISNSLKFVREGVQPVIQIDCENASVEDVAAYGVTKADRYFRLTFTDNGIGFEDEYAQKIFAIFQRLHGRSEYEGSGIGLAICKKIAEHHGGVIFAHGQPEVGATFTIILPA